MYLRISSHEKQDRQDMDVWESFRREFGLRGFVF